MGIRNTWFLSCQLRFQQWQQVLEHSVLLRRQRPALPVCSGVTLYAGEDKNLDIRLERVAPTRKEKPSSGAKTGKDPVTGMEFVWVTSGCYEMGCGSWDGNCDGEEKPGHKACVDGFWMGKYEVTQGQWKKVMGSNPSPFRKGDNYPVERVSWNDAKKFINPTSWSVGVKWPIFNDF